MELKLSNKGNNCRFMTFENFHGKRDIGSTYIRVHQLIKYWEEAELYLYGENPEVLIFQKVYCTPDYTFPAHFEGIKILDLCDADWLNGVTSIKETVDAVDAVTCSSDNLTNFIKQMTNKPVVTIKDRFDLAEIPKPKKHTKIAKTVVWFGYRHNAELLKPAMRTLSEMNLDLLVIADDDPLAWQWLLRHEAEKYRTKNYKYLKYTNETIYKDLQRADICLLPAGTRPIDHFKSNNKTVKAILAGLPVATNADELRQLIEPLNRSKYMEEHYKKTKEDFDVHKSIEELKQLIEQIQANKKA